MNFRFQVSGLCHVYQVAFPKSRVNQPPCLVSFSVGQTYPSFSSYQSDRLPNPKSW